MKIEEIIKRMKEWKDFYGGGILDVASITKIKTVLIYMKHEQERLERIKTQLEKQFDYPVRECALGQQFWDEFWKRELGE